MSVSPSGQAEGNRVEPSSPVWRTALAERPGQPYPATFRKWTHRESNPNLQSAELVSSRWTMSPCSQGSGDRTHVLQLPRLADRRFPIPCPVDREGLAPSFPACGAGVVLLDQQPKIFQRSARDLNPASLLTTEACRRNTCRPVIPDGLEPSLPGCGPGVFAAGPRDQQVAEVGIEPTIDHQALDLAALPRLRTRPSKLRRPDSNRHRTAYETVLETRLQSTPQ